MSIVQATLADTLASLGLLCILAMIGYPIGALIGRIGQIAQPPIGVSWTLGFFWISVGSWKAFEAGTKLAVVYRGSLVAAVVLALVILLLGRRWPTPRSIAEACRGIALDLVAFGSCAAAYAWLVHSKLKPGDLGWPTILNADIFVYIKASAYLALFPGGQAAVGEMDLHGFVGHDVFGAFGLMAFAKFVLYSDLAHLAIPTMGLGVGLIGMATARSCRVTFGIGLPLSLLVGLMTVTGPLFQYIALNYFLGQILFLALMLTVVLWVAETQPVGWRSAFGGSVIISTASGAVLLCYDVWAFQFVAIVSALIAGLRLFQPGRRQRDRVGLAIVSGVCSGSMAIGVMTMTSASRLLNTLSKLVALSVPNAAGWPLPFVDIGLLLGLPFEWGSDATPDAGFAGSVMGAVLLLAVIGVAVAALDHGGGSVGRKATFSLFCVGAITYWVIWARFGDSYQQWKFASTFPLGFGFAVLATVAHLLRLDASRRWATATGLVAAVYLVACIGLDISFVREKLMATLAHLPASLSDLVAIDERPGNEPIYVDTSDFQVRMAALALIDRKPVSFSGTSQFGPGRGPPTDGRYLTMRQVCDPDGESRPAYKVEAVRSDELPSVPLNQTVLLSHDVAACLSLTGFGDPEPWGRRSVGHHAEIRFGCACDLATDGLEVVLRAGAPMMPDLPGQQVARIAVDGAPATAFPLNDTEFRDIVIPVPRHTGGGSGIDLQIDLPDAVPRMSADPGSANLFALSLVSLELRRRVGDR